MRDELDKLFDAARAEIPDNGFSQRVMQHAVAPPSRNIYRVPALAMAVVSVVVLVLTGGRGFGVADFAHRVSDRMEMLSTVSSSEWGGPDRERRNVPNFRDAGSAKKWNRR